MPIDPLTDFKTMIDNGWTVAGGTEPEIELEQDFRYIPIETEYILLNSLNQGDNHFGVGAVDYLRDIGISVMIHTNTSRARMIELLEECRRILRTKANWTVGSNKYDLVQMSVDTDLSDKKRNDWTLSFDVTAILIESV